MVKKFNVINVFTVLGTTNNKDGSFVTLKNISVDSDDYKVTSLRNHNISFFMMIQNREILYLPVYLAEKFPSITKIYVERCSVQKLSSNNFKSLKKLRTIELEKNRITSIERNTFTNLNSLKLLTLTRNNLTSLENRFLDPLVYLEAVNFEKNQIATIPDDFFSKQLDLHYVNFKSNKIVRLSMNIFAHNTHLVVILFTSNKINIIEEGSWSYKDSKINIADFGNNECIHKCYTCNPESNPKCAELSQFHEYLKENCSGNKTVYLET